MHTRYRLGLTFSRPAVCRHCSCAKRRGAVTSTRDNTQMERMHKTAWQTGRRGKQLAFSPQALQPSDAGEERFSALLSFAL